MQNVITELELIVGLSKVKSALGVHIWEVNECCRI